MTRAQHLRLTGHAAQFLRLVQDLGHLDEEAVARLLQSVGAQRGERSGLVELDELRRAVAHSLFERSGGTIQDGLLGEDWPLLFS
jgi:hypothetical protein